MHLFWSSIFYPALEQPKYILENILRVPYFHDAIQVIGFHFWLAFYHCFLAAFVNNFGIPHFNCAVDVRGVLVGCEFINNLDNFPTKLDLCDLGNLVVSDFHKMVLDLQASVFLLVDFYLQCVLMIDFAIMN